MYGDEAFLHEDWMEEQWKWKDVKVNCNNISAKQYKGPSNISSFLSEFLLAIMLKQNEEKQT